MKVLGPLRSSSLQPPPPSEARVGQINDGDVGARAETTLAKSMTAILRRPKKPTPCSQRRRASLSWSESSQKMLRPKWLKTYCDLRLILLDLDPQVRKLGRGSCMPHHDVCLKHSLMKQSPGGIYNVGGQAALLAVVELAKELVPLAKPTHGTRSLAPRSPCLNPSIHPSTRHREGSPSSNRPPLGAPSLCVRNGGLQVGKEINRAREQLRASERARFG
jgi:hypothetical protein